MVNFTSGSRKRMEMRRSLMARWSTMEGDNSMEGEVKRIMGQSGPRIEAKCKRRGTSVSSGRSSIITATLVVMMVASDESS